MDIAALLKNLGAKVRALDPMADLSELNDSERNSLPFSLDSQNSPSLAESDALVLVTEWPEFLKLDWKTIARDSKVQMVVDTKNFLKPLDEFPELLRIIPGKILPDRIGELSHE